MFGTLLHFLIYIVNLKEEGNLYYVRSIPVTDNNIEIMICKQNFHFSYINSDYKSKYPTLVHNYPTQYTFYCQQEPCPRATIFEVVDEKGNILETANNSAGIYSTLQGVPLLPPPIERTTLYEDTNTYQITIRCPGYVNLYHNDSI